METFRVHILGCGSALPTLKHGASSQVVEVRGKLFMIDCGEGTQTLLRRSRLKFTKISSVFISHLHGDHCFGLIGMISTFGMLGRTAPLHVYAPAELRPILDMQMAFFCKGMDYEIVFHPVDTARQTVIYEDRSVSVETVPLLHRVPCCGFIFREKPTLPHIDRAAVDYYGIPTSQLNNIKNGADWTCDDGTVIPNIRLTRPAETPRSYAYCSDTKYIPELYRIVRGVTVMYHESTYMSTDGHMADTYFHSTAAQAARVAKDAGVGKLLLGHYSARYDIEACLLAEAQAIFPNSALTNEGMVFDI